ncbi:MAG: methyltransferase [Thermoleophilaceae bacterium]
MSVRVPEASAAPPLKAALERSNYTEGGLMVALGTAVESSPGDAPVQSRRLGDNAQAVLARLFLLGVAVDADRARTALEPASLDELRDAGFLEDADDGLVRSPLRISPFEGVLLAHDPDVLENPEDDIVTGLNSAARTLASLTPRIHARRALDIGTGCGVQALLVAKDAEHVVATDVNTRALAYTRLGAALNGFEHVETREGSFFDPVEGEEFDLIVSNPPYVISPDSSLVYRDAGLEGDEVSRLAVAGAASHLAAGGHAMLLANWVHDPWEPWADPIVRWLEGSGCDAVLLHHLTEDGLEYAAKWNARYRRRPEVLAEVIDQWVKWYRESGIASLATGGVALRRSVSERAIGRAPNEGLGKVSALEMATGPSGQAGEHILRLFAAADTLAEMDDAALLAAPLALVPNHALHRERSHDENGYGLEKVRLVLADNAGLATEFGPVVAAVLVGLDGNRTVDDLLERMAAALGTEPAEAQEAVLRAVRSLIEQGYVTVTSRSSS